MFNCSVIIDYIKIGCIIGGLESAILTLFLALPFCLANRITSKKDNKSNCNFKKLLKKHAANNSKLIHFIDRLPIIYMHIVIYLPRLLLYAYLVWTVDETVNSEIANTINNFSNVIYTIILGTIGIIIICASLKKNYYVVFNYNDVTHKYKFLPVSINLIFILVLTTINQIILYTCNHIVCYVCIYPLIIFAIILSGYLLLVTLILLFSNTQAELTILNSLRFIYNDRKNISIESDNAIGTTTNIQYLCNKYIKRLYKLYRKCNNNLDNKFVYKYSAKKKVFNKKSFCNCLKTVASTIIIISIVLSVFTAFVVNAKIEIDIFNFFFVFISCLISSICVFTFLLLLLIKIKPIRRNSYNMIYGKKTHFIFYGNNKKYYFSDFAVPFFYYHSGLEWLHSLKNLDAFFKIYTNTNNANSQIDRMKKVINIYKEYTSIFFKNNTTNAFIVLPIILFLYHGFLNFKDKQSVIAFYKIQNIAWDKELRTLSKSIIKDLYKDHTKFNQFLRDIDIA